MRKLSHLKQAIEWVGRQGQHDREFLSFVALRFDLNPLESEFLLIEFAEPSMSDSTLMSMFSPSSVNRPPRQPDLVEATLGQNLFH